MVSLEFHNDNTEAQKSYGRTATATPTQPLCRTQQLVFDCVHVHTAATLRLQAVAEALVPPVTDTPPVRLERTHSSDTHKQLHRSAQQ